MVNLNLKRINSLSPYRLTPTSRPLFYKFVTDFDVNYTIGFMPDNLQSEIEAYEFVIINDYNLKSPRDPKLKRTILSLVYEFFHSQEAVMLYLCDTGDERQAERSRLFTMWFRNSPYSQMLACLSADFCQEGIINYLTIITRLDHPRFTDITRLFGEAVQIMRKKPE